MMLKEANVATSRNKFNSKSSKKNLLLRSIAITAGDAQKESDNLRALLALLKKANRRAIAMP